MNMKKMLPQRSIFFVSLFPPPLSADAVDMALEIPAADQFGEQILLEDRNGAGDKAGTRLVDRNEFLRQQEVARAERRCHSGTDRGRKACPPAWRGG